MKAQLLTLIALAGKLGVGLLGGGYLLSRRGRGKRSALQVVNCTTRQAHCCLIGLVFSLIVSLLVVTSNCIDHFVGQSITLYL